MRLVTSQLVKRHGKWAALGMMLLIMISYQPAAALTNYVFFYDNGDTSGNQMVQGDMVAWGSNCDTAAALNWEIWLDVNLSSNIETDTDVRILSFVSGDGDTSSVNRGMPDYNPVPDGWFMTPPALLGIAPGHYIFVVVDLSDNSTAQRVLISNALPSPPNMFRGRLSLEDHPAPDSMHLRNIWIEADLEENGFQMWSGLTDDNGFYQINIGNAGTGRLFNIRPADIPGYAMPGSIQRVASGIVDSINFFYSAPADSIYGIVKDQNENILNMPLSGFCNPMFGQSDGKDFQTENGSYKIYFGSSEYGQWSLGLSPDGLVPDYLCPMNFNFDNSVVHSQRHDFVCYTTDTVIYARVTEGGAIPTHSYLVGAQSNSLQMGTYAVSGTGGNNLVTMHISSLDQSDWCVNVISEDSRYPIPPGYVLDGMEQLCGHNPGDTLSLNFIYGRMVRDTLRLDPGDTPPNWNNMWVNLFNDQKFFNGTTDNNGVFTIYADTGTYTLNINQAQYLSDPNRRSVRLTTDTTGGLGFTINEAHCRVRGTLANIPLPLPNSNFINAHTASGNNGYSVWFTVDSVSGTFNVNLCDGNWTIDPPYIPDMIMPPPATFVISERPDTVRNITFTYEYLGVDNPDGSLPTEFALHQNYPNPFNARTSICFALPKAAHVSVQVYDLLGREVGTLLDEDRQAGYYLVTWNAGDQPSGIYFYKIQADKFSETRKMLMVK